MKMKVSIYRNQLGEGTPNKTKETSPRVALDELITYLAFDGRVVKYELLKNVGDSIHDSLKITILTHSLGPVPTPYAVVFEGLLETEMGHIGQVVDWFVNGTRKAADEVLEYLFR